MIEKSNVVVAEDGEAEAASLKRKLTNFRGTTMRTATNAYTLIIWTLKTKTFFGMDYNEPVLNCWNF